MFARALLALAFLVVQPSAPNQDTAGTLVIKNSQWDAVQVEVRLGRSTDCAANASVGTRTLKREQRWMVVTDRVICWRREAVPGDATQGWTGWTNTQVAIGTKQEVAL